MRERRAGEIARADEDDRPRLDVRQQRILLRATEAVQLVDEEERLLAVGATLGRRGDRASDLGDTVARGGEARRHGAHPGRDHRREGRLSAAGWPPEQQRRRLPALQEEPQRCARSDEGGLPHHLVERRRAHPRRERDGRGEGAEERRPFVHPPDHRTLSAALG